MIIAVIPAHNEEAGLADTIMAIRQQTVPPDLVCVVSDNSTDRTVEIAREHGCEVYETVRNTNKKAGALSQFIERLARRFDPVDTYVLIVDADSALRPEWIERALIAFDDEKVGAVGGIFLGDGENGLLGMLQHMEYVRYAREIGRMRGKAKVLTGTSTMVRLSILEEVRMARRNGELPEDGYYNLAALTEDFELTLCIKRLGYTCVSPRECLVQTETMPTLEMLWKQRLRWQRGALQTLSMHGLNRTTLPYIVKQAETGFGILVMILIWAITWWSVFDNSFAWRPFWMIVGGVFVLERVVSVWREGWTARLIAMAVVPDLAFDMFIAAIWFRSLGQALRGGGLVWGQDTIDADANADHEPVSLRAPQMLFDDEEDSRAA